MGLLSGVVELANQQVSKFALLAQSPVDDFDVESTTK
jgi:hypothetical protein